jgi:hypothetical protein
MQFSINKAKATAIIVTILMITSIAMATVPAQAQETAHGGPAANGYEGPTTIPAGQTADFTISPIAFLSVSPGTIGLGQELLVNVWITFPSGEGKYMTGYTVTITHPDGTTEDEQLKSYVADGTSWFTYVPNAVGQWSFVFKFAGEYFPAGYYVSGQYSTNRTGQFAGAIFNPSDYVLPATSQVRTITVQSDFVASWHSPLPTDYWSRPIEPNNREWAAIAGNFPFSEGLGNQAQCSWTDEYYGPFITAPDTPHILWQQQNTISGIIGGEAGQQSLSGSGSGTPSVIYIGRCYATQTVSIGGIPTSCAVCYDLQTGQYYYQIPTASGGVTPTRIAYWPPNVSGATGTVPGEIADLGWTIDLFTISGTRLYKINPQTGAVSANISLPSDLGTGTGGGVDFFYRDGYYLSYHSVNSTSMTNGGITVARATSGFLVNWTEQGSSSNFASRIVSNISITLPQSLRTLYEIGAYGNLGAYDPDTGITVVQSRFIYGGYYGSNFWAVNLLTGQTQWNVTTPVSVSEDAYRPTNAWCRHGRYIAEMERGYLQAYDIRTGTLLWTSETGVDSANGDYPWGEFYMYDEAAYNDVVYVVGYVGVIAFNETNGKIVWRYVDPAVPFETPYTSANGTIPCYSVQNIRIADGKIYVQNSEHTPSLPRTRGWGMFCLNLTDGSKLWKISGTLLAPGPASDGYMVSSSSYDGSLNVLGKGPSATTVTAPLTTVAKGDSVLIQGTVKDMSAAQPNTACIADQYMDTWMDYLHFQMPVDGYYHNITVTGVDVLLVATDSSGASTTVGTATSDTSGTFAMAWTPPAEGTYRITAIFAGSGSYGSSTATTAVNVGPATPTPETPTYPVPIDYTWTIVGAAIAIIIVVILVGIAIIMRKK